MMAALMTVRATRRDRVLVSRAIHRHYADTMETYFSPGSRHIEELPTLPDGTTDLAVLQAALADDADPVAGVVMASRMPLASWSRWLEPLTWHTRPAPCSSRWSSQSHCLSWRHQANMLLISQLVRDSHSASGRNTGVRTWACLPAHRS